MDFKIVNEKLDQATAILGELNIDMWMTYVRETVLTPDPCLDLVAGLDLTWHSAFILTRSGERIAIVGRFDGENVRAIGGYTKVITYDQGIRASLFETVSRLGPQTIALNYSMSDPAADGLTYGMQQNLLAAFEGTAYAKRFVSAEKLVAALRGRKSKSEQAHVKAAIRTTEKLLDELGETLKPGLTELHIAEKLHAARRALGLGTAWGEPYCPIVNAGPESAVGHAAPGTIKIARGQLLHVDFGVKQDGFCADLQRMWYFLAKDEKRPPAEVQRAWDACWAALDAGAEKLKPGAVCWEVDAAARASLTKAGYPEFQHALGHHLGRVAHDGASLLGPRWEKYGTAPLGIVEPGNIFTLELGVAVPERGFIGLEEDVLVTESGLEWLSKPQRKIWLV